MVNSVDDFADRKSAPVGVDAATVATFVTLAAYAWFIYGLGPSIPLLREELGTSSTIAGLHSLLMSAGVVPAGFFGVRLVRRWRRFGAALRGVVGLAVAAPHLSPDPCCPPGSWRSPCRRWCWPGCPARWPST